MTTARRVPWRPLLLVVSVAAALTLMFTVQEWVRPGPPRSGADLGRSLAFNALDWFGWALLVPLVVTGVRRWRLDTPAGRGRHLALLAATGAGLCLGHSAVVGILARSWGLLSATLPPLPLVRFILVWTTATVVWNALIFIMIAGVAHAWLSYHDLQARRQREADLAARLARAELNVLRMQLQPHFVFNALHTVSSLMISDVATAQQVVAALGEILRLSIDHTAKQEVSLREELAFVGRYLEIQKARFRSRLLVSTEVPDPLLEARVPSLVLQPLVENAIRHGVERRLSGGAIWMAAARSNGSLLLTVRNNGPDPASRRSTSQPAESNSGVGLANIAARLAQLYPGRHRFEAGEREDGSFEVTLEIPYQAADATGGHT